MEPTERAQFLDDAVSGLAEDDRVICVRIALFCELFQGKPWDLKTLEKAGGVEGVGVLFMEETFSADKAPAENRYHQKAVRSVLNTLLPEPGSKIKGRMRSDRDLMDVSGYADRPDDFQALVRILDEKTHLITPTDPEGLGAEEGGVKKPSVGRFYQLTHDYLVPSIREWLTRKQRETRGAGPSFDWPIVLRSGTPSPRTATCRRSGVGEHLAADEEERLDRTAEDDDAEGGTSQKTECARLGSSPFWSRIDRAVYYSAGLVQQLRNAEIAKVPQIVQSMRYLHLWIDPSLRKTLRSKTEGSDQKLKASLALLDGGDPSQITFLEKRLHAASSAELPVVRNALRPYRDRLAPQFWSLLISAKPDDPWLLPAASALADYDASSPRWESVGGKVAQALVSVNSIELGDWLKSLSKVRRQAE